MNVNQEENKVINIANLSKAENEKLSELPTKIGIYDENFSNLLLAIKEKAQKYNHLYLVCDKSRKAEIIKTKLIDYLVTIRENVTNKIKITKGIDNIKITTNKGKDRLFLIFVIIESQSDPKLKGLNKNSIIYLY